MYLQVSTLLYSNSILIAIGDDVPADEHATQNEQPLQSEDAAASARSV